MEDNTVTLKLDPGSNGGKWTPEIVIHTTDRRRDRDIMEIVDRAKMDIMALLKEMQDGGMDGLPENLFSEYADLEWVRNLPSLAANGLLSPAFLHKKLADSPVRSKNDARLVLLATEFCVQEAQLKFGTAIIHGFGKIYEQAVKSRQDIDALYKKVNTDCCEKVLKVSLGLGEDKTGLSLAEPGTSQPSGHRPHRPT